MRLHCGVVWWGVVRYLGEFWGSLFVLSCVDNEVIGIFCIVLISRAMCCERFWSVG